MEMGRMDMCGVVALDTGEEVFLGDLLCGLGLLPLRQRQAFELICLQGFTETAARDVLLPDSESSTPVQQYADSGLIRMVHAYDCKQVGIWPPTDIPKSKKKKRFTMALHPVLRQSLEEVRRDYVIQVESIQSAMAQIDELLGKSKPVAAPPAAAQPAPNPKPEGKPDLTEMARELAKTG